MPDFHPRSGGARRTRRLSNLPAWLPATAAWLALTMVWFGAAAEKLELNPAEFKAAILSKIPPYIDWSNKPGAEPESPLVIGTLGEVDFKGMLEELVKNKQVSGRTVVVRKIEDAPAAATCSILFIPEASYPEWQKLRQTIDTKGILTVGESDRFPADAGIIFNLVARQRILEINLKNAKDAGLKVRPQLLQVARVIK